MMVEDTIPEDDPARTSGPASAPSTWQPHKPADADRLRRVLHLHSAINRALLEADTEEDLLPRVCQAVIETGGYPMAWLGRVDPDEGSRVTPVAQAGFEDGFLGRARRTGDDPPRSRGPSARAVRSGEPQIAQDLQDDPAVAPWRQEAAERGCASSAAIPVPIEGRVELVLQIYAEATDAFQPDEIDLLGDVGVDLGLGLGALREKAVRARNEEELEARADELARSNADLERFAFVASHDLKEPVRTIHSFAQMLQRQAGDDLDEGAQASLGFILEAADRLYQLIHDLLEYTSGRQRPLTIEPVDLTALMDQVQLRLQAQIESSGAAILVDELPVIRADRTAMGQVLQQLLENAIRYSGDDPAIVHISAQERDDGWELLVQDDGLGIDETDQQRIFDIFFKPERKTATGGTGVGLAIVRSIICRHGGRVWVDSTPGQGATFHLWLPDETPATDDAADQEGGPEVTDVSP